MTTQRCDTSAEPGRRRIDAEPVVQHRAEELGPNVQLLDLLVVDLVVLGAMASRAKSA